MTAYHALTDEERTRLRTTPWARLDITDRRRAMTTVLAEHVPEVGRILRDNPKHDLRWAEATYMTETRREGLKTVREHKTAGKASRAKTAAKTAMPESTPTAPDQHASDSLLGPEDGTLTHGGQSMTFVDALPADERRKRATWEWQATEMRRRPGQWALLRTEPASLRDNRLRCQMGSINHGRLTAFRPQGDFEARVIVHGGVRGLYARYTGKEGGE